MPENSKIYVGKVIHRRFKPKNHYFKYRVFSLLIDLDDLNEIDNKIKLFSYNKFNIISFFDKDHGDRDGTSLKNWVKKKLENIGIDNKEVKIKLFCYPRILGYVFNPLSVFFIYDKYDKIISLLSTPIFSSFFFTQFFKDVPSLSPWSLSKKLMILNLLYENNLILLSISFRSSKSINNEKTLYLK